MITPKIKKILFVTLAIIIGFIAIIIIFISPITKYLIEKYDEKYTGRQIKMDWAYVNPFTGNLHFSNLKIHESNSDSVFFAIDGFNAGFSLFKMLSGTYEITSLTLNKPKAYIVQNKTKFNFDDIIEKFAGKDSDTVVASSPVHFNINKIKINDGEFHFLENEIPINYFIKNVNIESNGKNWDVDTVNIKFSFQSGIGEGFIKGNCTIDLKSQNYDYYVSIQKFDLKIIEQYLKDLTNYGTFRASLDADLKSKGNFTDQNNVTFKGIVIINEFHFGKNADNDYAAFEKLTLNINELSPNNHKYIFDSVTLIRPYFKYEMYDSLDNMETMFGKGGSNIEAAQNDPQKFNLAIELARYVKVLAKNFFESYYKISQLSITKGEIIFNDYSPSEKFSMSIDPLEFYADSIDKKRDKVDVIFKTGFKPYGNFSMNLSISPKDSADFDLQYAMRKLPISMFNPYIISFTSFPLDRGTMEINGEWNVRDGLIKSNNHLVVIDPRVTKKIRNKDTKWIPLPLVMAFIRERGNVIDYEIPITGNLKDPKFHLRDIIGDLFKNIFVKPVTTPYRTEVKNVENEIEKTQTLKWEMRKSELSDMQEKFMDKIADFLTDNPEASISIHPVQYAAKEKEYLTYFEAKKKFFFSTRKKEEQVFNKEDSIRIDKLPVKDPAFIKYLNNQVKDSMIFSILEKCTRLIGAKKINSLFEELNNAREKNFRSYFTVNDLQSKVKIHQAENTIPYNGFSFYNIDYKGDIPESLLKAYQKMNELNQEAPRKKFLDERKKNKNLTLVQGN